MQTWHRHPVEVAGYVVVLLVLVGFVLVGLCVPDPEALAFDALLSGFTLLGVVLFGLGRWVLRKPPAHWSNLRRSRARTDDQSVEKQGTATNGAESDVKKD